MVVQLQEIDWIYLPTAIWDKVKVPNRPIFRTELASMLAWLVSDARINDSLV